MNAVLLRSRTRAVVSQYAFAFSVGFAVRTSRKWAAGRGAARRRGHGTIGQRRHGEATSGREWRKSRKNPNAQALQAGVDMQMRVRSALPHRRLLPPKTQRTGASLCALVLWPQLQWGGARMIGRPVAATCTRVTDLNSSSLVITIAWMFVWVFCKSHRVMFNVLYRFSSIRIHLLLVFIISFADNNFFWCSLFKIWQMWRLLVY